MISIINNVLALGIIPGNSGGSAAAATETAAQAADQAGGFGNMNSILMIVVWVAVIGVFYFFSIRPQSKREKKLKEMQASIKSGDNVVTSNGFFGKVADVGEDCFIIEFGINRGVRIPVRKTDVTGIQTPNISQSHASKSESGS